MIRWESHSQTKPKRSFGITMTGIARQILCSIFIAQPRLRASNSNILNDTSSPAMCRVCCETIWRRPRLRTRPAFTRKHDSSLRGAGYRMVDLEPSVLVRHQTREALHLARLIVGPEGGCCVDRGVSNYKIEGWKSVSRRSTFPGRSWQSSLHNPRLGKEQPRVMEQGRRPKRVLNSLTRNESTSEPLTITPKAPFNREKLVNHLEKKLIETSPVMP